MTKFKMCLSSTTYKNHILEGFSQLQQSDEFVDLTLAAEGHLVKVHQTIVALASPYLKELLRSVPCHHPVIFLNDVSHEVLSFILEYIYRGEVHIPAGKVEPFLKLAQAMHIVGLKDINPPVQDENSCEEKQTTNVFYKPRYHLPVKANITISNENNFDLPIQEPIIEIPDDTDDQSNGKPALSTLEPSLLEANLDHQNFSNMNSHGKSINVTLNDCVTNNNISEKPVAKIEIISNTLIGTSMNNQAQTPQLYDLVNMNNKDVSINNNETNISMDTPASSSQINLSNVINMGGKLLLPQYTSEDIIMSDFVNWDNIAAKTTKVNNTENTNEMVENGNETGPVVYTVSNRGALQMIMNKFMFYCHYQTDNGRKRRWRCIDYRDSHCRASIDTDGEQIVARKHKHFHPNHDAKIQKKMNKSNVKVFSAIQEAEAIVK